MCVNVTLENPPSVVRYCFQGWGDLMKSEVVAPRTALGPLSSAQYQFDNKVPSRRFVCYWRVAPKFQRCDRWTGYSGPMANAALSQSARGLGHSGHEVDVGTMDLGQLDKRI